MSADPRPLVVHVVYRFDTGGLENGVVNLVNRLPADAWRHAVVALTEVTGFRARVERDDVAFVALGKGPGHALPLYPRIARLFRTMRPAIVHTRNLAALEMAVPAWMAGVPVRVHGEHGRDTHDLDGSRRRYRWVRRAYRPFVTQYVALSGDLARYLVRDVGIPAAQVDEICNGVDAERFHPPAARGPIPGCPFGAAGEWLVGTVGRLQAVKDHPTLARAFVQALDTHPSLRATLRLVVVGDGATRAATEAILAAGGVRDLAWFAGERDDVPAVLRGLDTFVLPSLAEGISNTVLEAMASGLPVIATAVGGNPELVDAPRTGALVPASDPAALAACLAAYALDREAARAAGRAGRARVEQRYALAGMVSRYDALYRRLLAAHAPLARAA